MTESRDASSSTGRGGLAVLFAKAYFIVVGLGQQVALRAVLGLDGYGALSTALGTASIVYNPITQASIQGASRTIAEANTDARPFIKRRLLTFHGSIGLVLGSLFFLASGPLARLLGAEHVSRALACLGIVLGSYGLYTPLVGVLNGERRFVPQAFLDVLATTLRTGGLVLGAYFATRKDSLLDGPSGSALGFAVSSLLVLALASLLVGYGKSENENSERPFFTKKYVAFLLPVFFGQFVLNLLFQADSLLLRRFAADAATLAGLPASAADPFVGAYRGAQLFCFLPYQLLMSVILVLFPLLSQARAEGNREKIVELVRGGLRLALLLAGAMVSVFVATPEGLLRLFLGAEAATLGASAMRILALGLGSFAVLGVMTTASNSLGGERSSLSIILLAFGLVVASCFGLTRGVPLGETLLLRTALATSLGLVVATIAAGIRLSQLAGASVPLLSVLRTVIAVGLAATLGAAVASVGIVRTLLGALVCVTTYGTTLVLTRELTGADRLALTRLLSRGRKKG